MASDFKLFKKKDDKKNNGQNFSLSDKSKFAIVESYKAARTNIMFSLSAKEKKCFAVTSYSKGEGKSTVSANLAISFSKMEKRVLLIDCDLRRPNVHNIFKLDNKKGLTNVIGKMMRLLSMMFFRILTFFRQVRLRQTPLSLCAVPDFRNFMSSLSEIMIM